MTNKPISPLVLTIDGNASCQLKCPTCPTTSNGYPPLIGSGHLTYKNLLRLLDLSPDIKSVRLENRGELFLNAELPDLLQELSKRNIQAFCDSGSNFNNVKEDVLEALVKYRFKSLVVSIDGASEETYRQYRIGGDFNRIVDNIRKLNKYKTASRSRFPRLIWQFIVFGHNEHEIPAARRMAQDLGMEFYTKMSWDAAISPIRNVEFVKSQTGWQTTTREEFNTVTGKDYMRSTCYALWHSPRINWDGKVLGCCWNSWAEFGGSAFTDGYTACCNGTMISHAREMLKGELPHRDDLPCSTCDLYLKIKSSKKWLSTREIQNPVAWWYPVLKGIYRGLGSYVRFIQPLKRLIR